jgi:hypothetical protein
MTEGRKQRRCVCQLQVFLLSSVFIDELSKEIAVASAYLILFNIQISEYCMLMCYAHVCYVIYTILRMESYYFPERLYYTRFCIEDAVFSMQ